MFIRFIIAIVIAFAGFQQLDAYRSEVLAQADRAVIANQVASAGVLVADE